MVTKRIQIGDQNTSMEEKTISVQSFVSPTMESQPQINMQIEVPNTLDPLKDAESLNDVNSEGQEYKVRNSDYIEYCDRPENLYTNDFDSPESPDELPNTFQPNNNNRLTKPKRNDVLPFRDPLSMSLFLHNLSDSLSNKMYDSHRIRRSLSNPMGPSRIGKAFSIYPVSYISNSARYNELNNLGQFNGQSLNVNNLKNTDELLIQEIPPLNTSEMFSVYDINNKTPFKPRVMTNQPDVKNINPNMNLLSLPVKWLLPFSKKQKQKVKPLDQQSETFGNKFKEKVPLGDSKPGHYNIAVSFPDTKTSDLEHLKNSKKIFLNIVNTNANSAKDEEILSSLVSFFQKLKQENRTTCSKTESPLEIITSTEAVGTEDDSSKKANKNCKRKKSKSKKTFKEKNNKQICLNSTEECGIEENNNCISRSKTDPTSEEPNTTASQVQKGELELSFKLLINSSVGTPSLLLVPLQPFTTPYPAFDEPTDPSVQESQMIPESAQEYNSSNGDILLAEDEENEENYSEEPLTENNESLDTDESSLKDGDVAVDDPFEEASGIEFEEGYTSVDLESVTQSYVAKATGKAESKMEEGKKSKVDKHMKYKKGLVEITTRKNHKFLRFLSQHRRRIHPALHANHKYNATLFPHIQHTKKLSGKQHTTTTSKKRKNRKSQTTKSPLAVLRPPNRRKKALKEEIDTYLKRNEQLHRQHHVNSVYSYDY
jgi:hypothetical protein